MGTVCLATIETIGLEDICFYFLIEEGLTDGHRGSLHERGVRHFGGHHFGLDYLVRAERIYFPQSGLFLIEQILKVFVGVVELVLREVG
jgi:hypothetical protein